MKKSKHVLLLFVMTCWIVVEAASVNAGWGRRTSRSRGYRPVTGVGSNLHRRFVLKRELRRTSQGKAVRYRGNIRWR